MDTQMMSLDSLVPYWRNPRRITDESVNAVAESIQKYGYNQPIVVDEESVIIIGHTRYTALRRLGYTDAPVKVEKGLSPQQVKQLRLIDNRTSELALWDYESLVAEIEDLDAGLIGRFFPEISREDADSIVDAEAVDPSAWDTPYEPDEDDEVDTRVEFVCPSCFNMWDQHVTREEVLLGKINPAKEASNG